MVQFIYHPFANLIYPTILYQLYTSIPYLSKNNLSICKHSRSIHICPIPADLQNYRTHAQPYLHHCHRKDRFKILIVFSIPIGYFKGKHQSDISFCS